MNKNKLKEIKLTNMLILFIVLLFMIAFFSFLNKQFISYNNISSLLKNVVTIGFLAIGYTPLMISGELDLSFGSNLSLISIIIAR